MREEIKIEYYMTNLEGINNGFMISYLKYFNVFLNINYISSCAFIILATMSHRKFSYKHVMCTEHISPCLAFQSPPTVVYPITSLYNIASTFMYSQNFLCSDKFWEQQVRENIQYLLLRFNFI